MGPFEDNIFSAKKYNFFHQIGPISEKVFCLFDEKFRWDMSKLHSTSSRENIEEKKLFPKKIFFIIFGT